MSAEELEARLPSGTNVFLNRVHWASTYLKKAGLLESAGRGVVRVTPKGQTVLAEAPARIDRAFLMRYPSFQEFVRPREPAGSSRPAAVMSAAASDTTTPRERIDAALAELREELADDLLAKVKTGSPRFFEALVVETREV